MGRQHAVRQASRQPQIVSQPNAASNQVAEQGRESRSSVQSVRPKLSRLPVFAGRLLLAHPWLLWIVAGAILVGSTTAAITTILDPDASISFSTTDSNSANSAAVPKVAPALTTHLPRETPALVPPASVPADSAAPTASHPQSLPHQPSAASPQSAVAAIALSCAAGCFLLSQWAKPKTAPRRRMLFEGQSSAKQIQQSNIPTQASTQATDAIAIAPIRIPSTPGSLALPALDLPQLPAASISFDLKPALGLPAEPPSAEAVEVTILPADQSHPMDWDEPSLADSLDLRQHRPLSYWL